MEIFHFPFSIFHLEIFNYQFSIVNTVHVTSPLLPDLDEFHGLLQQIWDARWITNGGSFHNRLEAELEQHLGVPHLSLFTNGTHPMVQALQMIEKKGEVITTPYSFVASANAIISSGNKPVFVDVDPLTGNISPERIEEAITPDTIAILPVHIYGQPCDTERISDIAQRHSLSVIYDAAHCFGVRKNGRSILLEGDMATISFHATKVFNTIEGGAIITKDKATKERIDRLRNFGFDGEEEIIGAGINNKMDEIRAAYGLLNLRQVDDAINKRRHCVERYIQALRHREGIRFLPMYEAQCPDSDKPSSEALCSGSDVLRQSPPIAPNYAYFPIFIDRERYGRSRDALYEELRSAGIFCRRYFYPLISDFGIYRDLPSARKENLHVAHSLADSVICLPVHHELSDNIIDHITYLI